MARAATDDPSERIFKFVQFDFAGSLGLPVGRWVVRIAPDAETTHVLVVEELPGDKPTRKQRSIKQPPAPGTLTISRITVINAVDADLERAEQIKAAISVIDRALHAKALAGREDNSPLSTPQWVGMRVGTGTGEQVAHSDWLEAEEIPLPETHKASRRKAEPTKGRFAELLGGKGTEVERAQLAEAPAHLKKLRELLSRRPNDANSGPAD